MKAGAGRRVDILRVSPDFLDTLGVGASLGRSFTEEEMTFETHHVAILSNAYWRRNFDANPTFGPTLGGRTALRLCVPAVPEVQLGVEPLQPLPAQ